jgi:VWFA-related protein
MTTEESTKNRAARRSLLWVLFLTLLIAGTIQVFARERAQSDPMPQVQRAQGEPAAETEVKTAYVAVLDKNGNPVTDLRREDFSISENNVRQEIVEVASAAETPLVIAVVVDVSGSTHLKDSGGEQLRAFASFLSKTLQSSDEAFVTMFADSSERLRGVTNNLAELQGGLKKISEARRHGSTALYDCLVSAAETMPKEPGKRKVILAMSDFEDNTSRYSLEKTVLRMQKARTAVFPLLEIAGEPQNKRGMNQGLRAANETAKESGGAAYVFEKPQGLETALERIRGVLRNSYAVKYRASGQAKKGKSVAVKIEVQRKDEVVIAARGRVAEVR